MAEKYEEFKGLNMPAIEQEMLARWKANSTFQDSISQREGREPFVFYEGPPSANGLPGIHHVISRTLKDLVCRYKTMKGFQVNRKAGWDTHGLPVELGVEKELGITKEDIGTKISVEDYNQKCREAVMRYKHLWEDITEKMGYWVEMTDPYVTFDNKYIESLWWCLKTLFDKGYLYKSVSIQPYSPAAGTGLSSHELNQPGTYKEVTDTTVVAMFKALDFTDRFRDASYAASFAHASIYFLAWTTTPWTLPSNCGLTVGPRITYALVETFNPYTQEPIHVVLAENLISKYFTEEGKFADIAAYEKGSKILPWKAVATFTGTELEGLRYQQLMPFEANTAAVAGGDPFRIITADFVTTEDGTGIVHTSPAFGADDYKAGQKNNLGMLTLVDKTGRFIEGVGEFSRRYVKNYKDIDDYTDVDLDIALKLKTEGLAFKVERYAHNYPHCWRTDKPIIYYPLDAWFIRTTACKDRMIELNKTINWKPKSTGEGRFGNWLENMVDWNLSRSRYWGTPLPVWVSQDGSETKCIGSVKELLEEMKRADKLLEINQVADYVGEEDWTDADLTALLQSHMPDTTSQDENRLETPKRKFDLHKPYVDHIILADKNGTPMHREPDLIDVWFDSGAMPYAQWHYPFENQDKVDGNKAFPADFIAEGVDQTRGWFYTLHALGVLLFDTVAYKTVVSNGLVLDKDGAKMSKRVGNVIDPFSTIEKYSADATRWYLITNASPWDSLRFDLNGIAEVQRKLFGTLYNTYQFFSLYANVDGFTFKEKSIPAEHRPEIDRWILSTLQTLVNTVNAEMDNYEPTTAGRAIEEFVDQQLSNWYVRLCRRRFWKGSYEQDKISAYQTLYTCLETICRLIAPISPFFADWMYSNLNNVTGRQDATSVHLADFPAADAAMIDPDLEERMRQAQDISSLILSLRKRVNIKVRQPLLKAMIPVRSSKMKEQIAAMEDLIKSEVNIKEIHYLTQTEGMISKKIKADFKVLGSRLGKQMKEAAAAIAAMSQEEIARLEEDGTFGITVQGQPVEIATSDVTIIAEDIPGWAVANKETLTVALDIQITAELQQEGIARELVNRLQKMRKDTGLEVTDRIIVFLETVPELQNAVLKYFDYICAEILADDVQFLSVIDGGEPIEINEHAVLANLKKTP